MSEESARHEALERVREELDTLLDEEEESELLFEPGWLSEADIAPLHDAVADLGHFYPRKNGRTRLPHPAWTYWNAVLVLIRDKSPPTSKKTIEGTHALEQLKQWVDGELHKDNDTDKDEDDDRYVFRRAGAFFLVRFDGESGNIPTNLDGAKYVFELLQHPNKTYAAVELSSLRSPMPNQNKPACATKTDNSNDGEAKRPHTSPISDSGKTDQRYNQEAMRKYQARIAEIGEELKEEVDNMVINRLQVERERIFTELKRITGLGGAGRIKGPGESTRSSVSQCIRRMVTKCREQWGLPRFADHLGTCIDKGKDLTYRPSSPIPDWKF